MEPQPERGRRLVEDCSSRGVLMMAAIVARVRWTASIAVMLGYLVADLAMNALRIQVFPKPIEASRIVREHRIEVHDSELLLLRLNVIPKLLVAHIAILPQTPPTVKG